MIGWILLSAVKRMERNGMRQEISLRVADELNYP
jgi:hypothetical protein